MSTFDLPRLHFTGRFQADTSTINNDVRHYKSESFQPQFQELMVGYGSGGNERTNGYWNPDGTGAWRMLGCTVTAATGPDGPVTEDSDDAVLSLKLAGSDTRVAGKLVDLDPQQQMVSQIWGLEMTLVDAMGNKLLKGRLAVVPFIDLWQRQQVSENFDQTLAAVYQSQLVDLTWGALKSSPFLQALKAASVDGRLAVRFNVFGFDRDPNADDFMTGKVVGTIGPARDGEPVHFTTGRQLVPSFPGPFPVTPAQGVNSHTAVVHADRSVVTVDLGNALPIVTAGGDPMPIGDLFLAVAEDVDVEEGGFVPSDELALIGAIPYTTADYAARSGVVDLDYSDNEVVCTLIADSPLVLVQQLGTTGYRVLVRETQGGLALRADALVHRLNPGADQAVTVYTTRYGVPCAAEVTAGLVPAAERTIGGAGTGARLNADTWPIPEVACPESALVFHSSTTIGDSGVGTMSLKAADEGPGCPRGYLDGQVYAVKLGLSGAPDKWFTSPWHFLSVLCWDVLEVDPPHPTWHRDIQPIFEQYGNLYPVMSRHWIDLSDYDKVVQHVRILRLAFSLPEENPNHMPVTRDLSQAKRDMILRWLGQPLRGLPGDRPASRAPKRTITVSPAPRGDVPDPGGKLDFLAQVAAARDGETS